MIQFWQGNRQRFPDLTDMDLTLVAVQVSYGASEWMFSLGGWHTGGRKNWLEKTNLAKRRKKRKNLKNAELAEE